MLKTLTIFLFIVTICHGSVVIPGNDQGPSQNIGLFFFGSDKIKADDYYNSLLEVHKKFENQIWIVLVSWSNGKNLNDDVTNGLNMLGASGMDFDANTAFYFAGHSSGTSSLRKNSNNINRISLQKFLRVGELNPGLPRDRRGYSPLY